MRAVALIVLALAACKGGAGEVNGIGPYQFGKSTRGTIHQGNCQPTDLADGKKGTWCFLLPPFKVGAKHAANVDLYFAGTEDSAPLVKVVLAVRGCEEQELDTWMRERFGLPFETKGGREFWKNDFQWIMAELPTEPGKCLVYLLPIGEAAEIERLKAPKP